jgi:MFS family permease
MLVGASGASILGFIVYALHMHWNAVFEKIWFLPLIYFILSIAHEGIRIGRKTYIVDIADGNKRTDYVAISNTFIGVILIFAGLFGIIAESQGLHIAILSLSIMGIIGVIVLNYHSK